MRLLFTSFPALGHFLPIAPLAAAAVAAGHDVMVVSGADLCRWAAIAEFDTHAVGATQSELIDRVRTADGDVPSDRMFTDVWVRAAFPAMLEVATAWRPDLVVHEEEEYAGPLVATMLGTPVVTHSWNSPIRPASERATAGRLLGSVWAEHCPGRPVRTTGDVYLDACPPPFQDHDAISHMSDVITVRPVSFPLPATTAPRFPPDLPRPAVYVTLGTVPVFSTPERLRHLVDALSPAVATVIVTTGPNPVASLGDLPSNVIAFEHLRQAEVLSNVDVVLSQGGAGGTLGAIEHGLPHLVIPFESQSQLALAAAVERVGAGHRLGPGQRDAATIRNAVLDLLTDPSYGQAATAILHDLRRLPSPNDILDRLAPGAPRT